MGPVTGQAAFSTRETDWVAEGGPLRSIRWQVFVEEQRVPADLEWDEEDGRSRHILAVAADGTPVGTGRLLRDGHIGRMAVLAAWRRQGVGSALMRHLLELAWQSGHERVVLHAQTHAVGFYRKHGFVPEGEEFMEAGIPHVAMTLRLRLP